MNREQKAEIIESLTQKLNECNFIYLTDVSSMDAQKTSALRRASKNQRKTLVKSAMF